MKAESTMRKQLRTINGLLNNPAITPRDRDVLKVARQTLAWVLARPHEFQPIPPVWMLSLTPPELSAKADYTVVRAAAGGEEANRCD